MARNFPGDKMWITFLQLIFLLAPKGITVSAKDKDMPCSDSKAPGDVWQEGCLVKSCKSGRVEERLADECVELIEKRVDEILDEKLAEKGIECSTGLTEDGKYQTPGIIVAGGEWQNKAKLIKLDSQEVCDLPDTPEYFDWASMDLLDGTPVMCGSWFGSPGNSRRKNETEIRNFYPVRSCVQLSPASKEAEWTIFTENIPYKRDHVSLKTSEGILLMGGYNTISVDLLKLDGSVQRGIFNLERMIDRGCGIEDEGTLIITGGGSNGNSKSIPTKTVDRYNSQGFVENLPEMNVARTAHGCGYYHRDGKKVLVVGGGYFGQEIDDYPYIRYQDIASTETLTLGSNAWSLSAPLPRAMGRFASVSLNNKIYFIVGDGKEYKASALLFQFDGEEWEEIQKVKYDWLRDPYRAFSAVAVDLATSGFDEFCH